MHTRAPSLRNSSAMALPIPLAPPVMTATLFSNMMLPPQSASSSSASTRKLTGRKPSLHESMADLGFFIQSS